MKLSCISEPEPPTPRKCYGSRTWRTCDMWYDRWMPLQNVISSALTQIRLRSNFLWIYGKMVKYLNAFLMHKERQLWVFWPRLSFFRRFLSVVRITNIIWMILLFSPSFPQFRHRLWWGWATCASSRSALERPSDRIWMTFNPELILMDEISKSSQNREPKPMLSNFQLCYVPSNFQPHPSNIGFYIDIWCNP
jgi:hypothetical protein